MSEPASASFFARVLANESTKRGVGGLVAAVIIACVTELWPSS
jgi:hypothetical protein